MNAVTFLAMPLPQVQLPQAGGTPMRRPQVPSDKIGDAPTFYPSDTPSVPETRASADKPSGTTAAEKPAAKPSEAAPTDAGDGTIKAEPVESPGVNGNVLLTAQAAGATVTPVTLPVATPTPIASSTLAVPLDAVTTTATLGKQIRQAASPPATATQTEAEGPDPSTRQIEAPPRQPVPNLSADVAKPQPDATDTAASAKPNALNALLESTRLQGAPSTTTQPAAPNATQAMASSSAQAVVPNASQSAASTAAQAVVPNASQPAASTAAQSVVPNASQPAASTATQPAPPQTGSSAQPVATPAGSFAAISDVTDADAPTRAHTTADGPTAPAISFGTDFGTAANVKTATAAYEAARAAAPIVPASEQVAMQIHHAIEDGMDKLTVELKPASLGRVQAEIQFQSDHRVHVVLSADRPATLDALRSDSRALERALQDAGLRADAGSLSFRFENGGGQPGFMPDGASSDLGAPAAPGAGETAPIALVAYASVARPGGIDIRV